MAERRHQTPIIKRPYQRSTRHSGAAAGLAPLELVLVLPLLLFLMALLINAGTTAAWKVRAEGAARDAVWRVRWPRSGDKPQPASWPTAPVAELGYGGLDAVDVLDFQEIDKPVARGPQIGQVQVNEPLLDPTRGGMTGTASIQRKRPLLPSLGDMNHKVDHPLIDDTWTYWRTNLSSTWARRIKVIYNLQEGDLNQWSKYLEAVAQVEAAVQQGNLLPLTFYLGAWDGSQKYEDPDFDRLAYSPTGFDPNSPDFHPALGSFTNLDPEQVLGTDVVKDTRVKKLIDDIKDDPDQQGDTSQPRTMAQGYINLYQSAISTVQQHLDSLQNSDPPADPSLIAAVQAELDARKSELEPKIEELKTFMSGL